MKNAYEFTLEHIGNDMHAGLLWQEYIGFLQNCRPGTATYTALYVAGMDESQRTTTLRWAAGGWGCRPEGVCIAGSRLAVAAG